MFSDQNQYHIGKGIVCHAKDITCFFWLLLSLLSCLVSSKSWSDSLDELLGKTSIFINIYFLLWLNKSFFLFSFFVACLIPFKVKVFEHASLQIKLTYWRLFWKFANECLLEKSDIFSLPLIWAILKLEPCKRRIKRSIRKGTGLLGLFKLLRIDL